MSIVDTSGMNELEKNAAVKSQAERLVNMLEAEGFEALVDHSGSAFGPSSYVRVYDPKTGLYLQGGVRVSDHMKTGFQATHNVNICQEEEFLAFIETIKKEWRTEDKVREFAEKTAKREAEVSAKIEKIRAKKAAYAARKAARNAGDK